MQWTIKYILATGNSITETSLHGVTKQIMSSYRHINWSLVSTDFSEVWQSSNMVKVTASLYWLVHMELKHLNEEEKRKTNPFNTPHWPAQIRFRLHFNIMYSLVTWKSCEVFIWWPMVRIMSILYRDDNSKNLTLYKVILIE